MGQNGMLIIIAIVVIIIFLLSREFWCWYFKINKRISLMEKQNEYFVALLKNKNIKLPDGWDDIKTSSTNSNVEQKKCDDCGKMVNIKEKQCPNCGNRDFSQI